MGDGGVSRLAADVSQRGADRAEVGAGQPGLVSSGVRRLPALHRRKVMDIVHNIAGAPWCSPSSASWSSSLAFVIIDKMTPYHLWKEIVEEKNIGAGGAGRRDVASASASSSRPRFTRVRGDRAVSLHPAHRRLRADLRADRRHAGQLPARRQRPAVLDGHRHLPVRDGDRQLPVALRARQLARPFVWIEIAHRAWSAGSRRARCSWRSRTRRASSCCST